MPPEATVNDRGAEGTVGAAATNGAATTVVVGATVVVAAAVLVGAAEVVGAADVVGALVVAVVVAVVEVSTGEVVVVSTPVVVVSANVVVGLSTGAGSGGVVATATAGTARVMKVSATPKPMRRRVPCEMSKFDPPPMIVASPAIPARVDCERYRAALPVQHPMGLV